jgi:serine/threonine-protein kinase RsbW
MPSESSAEVIELTFPASSKFVRLSRLAAASVAAELDFDVESVDDLRIAVDEAVTLLLSGAHEGTVALRFLPSSAGLVVDGRCDDATVEQLELSDLVEAILSATTDEHRFESGPGYRSFSIVKHRSQHGGQGDGAGAGAAGRGSGEDGPGLG